MMSSRLLFASVGRSASYLAHILHEAIDLCLDAIEFDVRHLLRAITLCGEEIIVKIPVCGYGDLLSPL